MNSNETKAGVSPVLSTAVLERNPLSLAEFIELVGGFELKPYQREMVAAIERGERMMLDPGARRETYSAWKKWYDEYLTATMRSNANMTGLAPEKG